MFTTPPQTPVGGFLEGLANRNLGSTLRAAWLNYVGGQLPNALDAINGGYYQFVDDIELSSDTKQIKVNAVALAQPTKLLGYTTIGVTDDVNYATGVGGLTVAVAATFTASVTYSGAITYSNTVQFDGAVTINAATTFTSNGDVTLQSGCAVTGSSGSSLTMSAGSTTTINGAATLAGTNTISGATTFSNTTTLNGTNTIAGTTTVSTDVTLSSGVDVLTDTRTYTRVCKPVTTGSTATWTVSSNPEIFPFEISQISTTTDTFTYLADVPDGATIISVLVTVDPPAAHGGEPASKPKIRLYKFNVLTRTKTLVTTYTDIATLPDYENQRLIQTATVSSTRDATRDVFVVTLEGESGANSLNGLEFAAPIVEFTRGKLGEE